MNNIPQPILDLILGFILVDNDNKEVILFTSLVNKTWLRASRRVFHPYDSLLFAASRNRIEIVQEILRDTQINPNIENNYLLRLAASNKSWDIVTELLKDNRVKPSEKMKNQWLKGVEQ